jgi:RimJ/RimL family protein N-acetyltransferase
MRLLPLEGNALIDLAAGWLGEKRVYEWLDFGGGVQQLDRVSLKIMAQRDAHILRLFTSDAGTSDPIGIVALSNVNPSFKTATLWTVLGERRHSSKGYAVRCSAAMLRLGFKEYGLQTINAWAVECNHASLRAIRKLNFTPIGRQRQCHYIDGGLYDRLWFDLTAAEHARFDYD